MSPTVLPYTIRFLATRSIYSRANGKRVNILCTSHVRVRTYVNWKSIHASRGMKAGGYVAMRAICLGLTVWSHMNWNNVESVDCMYLCLLIITFGSIDSWLTYASRVRVCTVHCVCWRIIESWACQSIWVKSVRNPLPAVTLIMFITCDSGSSVLDALHLSLPNRKLYADKNANHEFCPPPDNTNDNFWFKSLRFPRYPFAIPTEHVYHSARIDFFQTT